MTGAATTLETLVESAMAELARRRPVFHSEADFQLAFAWQVQLLERSDAVRLEKHVLDHPRLALDVLLAAGGQSFGVELKYPRAGFDAEVAGERFG